MINSLINYISKEIEVSIDTLVDNDIFTGDIHIIKENQNNRGLYISVVNVEEESALKNTSHFLKKNDEVFYIEPPVYLNIYLLFSVNFIDYEAGLTNLSKIIELFQHRRVFTRENATDTNSFPSNLEKIIFDFHNLNFEQLYQIWGILGGTYFPSVLYKVRLVKIEHEEPLVAGPEITTIQVTTNSQ